MPRRKSHLDPLDVRLDPGDDRLDREDDRLDPQDDRLEERKLRQPVKVRCESLPRDWEGHPDPDPDPIGDLRRCR